MFGFSFSKTLFTILAVLVVWYGYRWIGRAQARRQAELEQKMRRETRQASTRGPGGTARTAKTEDLIPCETCGAYVPAHGARSCGRAECPYTG
jgi:uncharacterized protein